MKIDKKIKPQYYSKGSFLKFLDEYKVNFEIIELTNNLPEKITHNKCDYNLFIFKVWYNDDNTYHTFELNYYSSKLNEFLLPSKVFNDVELSVKFLYTQLKDLNLL